VTTLPAGDRSAAPIVAIRNRDFIFARDTLTMALMQQQYGW